MKQGPSPTSSPLDEHTRHRLDEELAELRHRYRTLTAAVFDTDAVMDSGDQAQRLERTDDLARLSDRIHQIIEVLAGRVPPSPTDALPDGTRSPSGSATAAPTRCRSPPSPATPVTP